MLSSRSPRSAQSVAVAVLAGALAVRAFAPRSPVPLAPRCRSAGCPALRQEVASESDRAAAEEQAEEDRIRDAILAEVDAGLRQGSAPPGLELDDYGDPDDDAFPEDVDDDALDASELGQWTAADFLDRFDYEWDGPASGEPDPNALDPTFEYVATSPVDEDGIEVGWNPLYGASNPIDTRTILDPPDSYVIDERTRDPARVPRAFPEGDLEETANAEITAFRKSLKIIDTYEDPFLKAPVPRHTAKWHGYEEELSFPPQNFTNNRFTKDEDRTDFDALGPARARQVAVQMARAKNNEWLPAGYTREWDARKKAIYHEKGVITGSLLPGEIDADIEAQIRPALEVLGDVVELLSIELGTVFRFKYHGLIKNKRGMEAWAGQLIRDCDVECTGVVFETGNRKRDPAYDGGDHWYGPY